MEVLGERRGGAYLHEESDGFGEGGDGLLWLLDGAQVLHAVLAIPVAFFDEPGPVRGSVQRCPRVTYGSLIMTRNRNLQGSWNMTTTPSNETWTSAHDYGYGLRHGRTGGSNTALDAICAVSHGGLEAGERVLGERC